MRSELAMPLHGSRLIVALSGGADSTSLALILHFLRPRLECDLLAFHLDHGIRPEALQEAEQARALCSSLGIPCVVEREDVPAQANEQGIGLEEAGRLARKRHYLRLLDGSPESWIVTGHQLNDLAEDQFMRMLRGAGWPALGGMRGLVPEERLARPLLLTPKGDLLDMLRSLLIPWNEDPSNLDADFLRNRIRARVVPAMLDENPSYLGSAASLWRQARLDAGFWMDMENATPPDPLPQGGMLLRATVLDQAHQALRLRLYKRCLDALGPGQALAETMDKLDRSWRGKKFGAFLQFPGNKTATVTHEGISFLPASDA